MNTDLLCDLAEMSVEELKKVNTIVVDLIKNKRRLESALVKATMKVGDKVAWTGRDGELHTGTLDKMNRTKARVVQQDIQGRGSLTWTIPFNLLSLAHKPLPVFDPTTGEWE